MFGYSEAELARARAPKRSWFFWIRLLLELTLLLGVSGASAVLHVLTNPELIQRGLDELTAGMPVALSVGGLELDAGFDLQDRETWRVVLVGLRIDPEDPVAPLVTVERITASLPRLIHTFQTKEVDFGEGRIVGLHIHARMQRPPPPWNVTDPAISLLRSSHLEVWNGRYTALEDPPLLASDVHTIYGDLFDVTFVPGERLLSGHANLESPDLDVGGIHIDRAVLPHVRATDSNLVFERGELTYGTGHATVHGRVEELFKRPAVRLQVQMRRASLANVISTSTGEPSPILGHLDMDMLVRSGGTMPRGEAIIDGKATVTDGRLVLGERLPPILRTIIRYAPFMEVDESDNLKLNTLEGRLVLDRRGTHVEELLYHAEPNDLQLFGDIDEEGFRLVLRLVPTHYAHLRPGMGVVLTSTEDLLVAELASREELLPGVYGEDSGKDIKEVKAELRAARKTDRQQRRTERQAKVKARQKARIAARQAAAQARVTREEDNEDTDEAEAKGAQ